MTPYDALGGQWGAEARAAETPSVTASSVRKARARGRTNVTLVNGPALRKLTIVFSSLEPLPQETLGDSHRSGDFAGEDVAVW